MLYKVYVNVCDFRGGVIVWCDLRDKSCAILYLHAFWGAGPFV